MSLYQIEWRADSEQARLLIVHGVGEHIHRYESLAKELNLVGISVFGFDQIGHGRSEGARGHIQSWDDYRNPVQCAYERLLEENDLPIHIWGHSMGSLVVLEWFVTNNPTINSLILSGTLLQAKTSWWRIAAAKLLSSIAPRFSLPLGLSMDAISSQSETVETYTNDPLVHGTVSARWGNELLQALERTNNQLQSINIPVLIGHGNDDAINDPSASRRLAASVAGEHQLQIYPSARHEIHNDVSRDDWIARLQEWVVTH